MQVRRKRGTSSVVPTHDSCLSVTIISMTMCLVVCIILSYHSYFQLDIDQLSTSRLFITNKIDSFKSEVGSLISEIEHNKGFNDVESPEINVSIHHELQCPHSELFHFWKETTISDFTHKSPFANYGPANKYVTFEPGLVVSTANIILFNLSCLSVDVGGWNNIRMQMELVLVFAAATGRTLVLPPDQPMYLLNARKGHQKAHNFADFFPFELIKQRVPVMAMEEFLAKEAVTGGLHYSNGQVAYPPENKTEFVATDRTERLTMWAYLRNVSACPAWKNMYDFLVIPEGPGINASSRAMEQPLRNRQKVFSAGRKPYYYDDFWQNQKVIHFISKPELGYRLLEHFYVFLHFHDVEVDKVYKRFVRDYVHYIDVIFCKASLIVNKLLVEGKGRFSTFHIRRYNA